MNLDCMFFSDECDFWQFKCLSDGICIDTRRKCDGVPECRDNSDETNCEEEGQEQVTEGQEQIPEEVVEEQYPGGIIETVLPTIPPTEESPQEGNGEEDQAVAIQPPTTSQYGQYYPCYMVSYVACFYYEYILYERKWRGKKRGMQHGGCESDI